MLFFINIVDIFVASRSRVDYKMFIYCSMIDYRSCFSLVDEGVSLPTNQCEEKGENLVLSFLKINYAFVYLLSVLYYICCQSF